MKKLFLGAAALVCFSGNVLADCWTGKAEGVIQYANGKAAIDFQVASLGGANPIDATWNCKSNWVWIEVPYDNNDLSSVIISQSVESRMISLAEAAFKTDTKIRICFTASDGYCQATQVYDLGIAGSVNQ